jgi:glycosyltransferase involved in cell wall biosynthesis
MYHRQPHGVWGEIVDMRLLVLTADYPPNNWSGIGTAVAFQARALVRLGCDVRVITSTDHCRPGVEDPPIYHLSPSSFPLAPQTGDIVHVHSLRLTDLAVELANRFRLRLIYTAHMLVESELGRSFGLARHWHVTQRRLLQRADQIFFLNQNQQAEALAAMPELATRSAVLPHGVPSLSPQSRAARTESRIVFAGRLARSKGIDIAMDVFRILSERNSELTFWIAGAHGEPDMHKRVLEFASGNARVRIIGWLRPPALDQLFSQATLVLMPSRYEPFGMVALEAMRAGAPVLASRAGALSDILQPESGGIALAAFDVSAWRDACSRLLREPRSTAELGAKGPSYVASRYNSSDLASRYLKMIAQ